jgi:hypothetical protein
MYSNAALCETLVPKSLNHTCSGVFIFCKLQSVYHNEIQGIYTFTLMMVLKCYPCSTLDSHSHGPIDF